MADNFEHTADGVVTRPTRDKPGATLDRLQSLLLAKGVTIFARVDHAAGAAEAGLTMPASQLLVFGSPRGGTPIMVAAPLAALDLPFKVLAWADADGRTWLSYNDPRYLARRFGLRDDQVAMLTPLVGVIEQSAD